MSAAVIRFPRQLKRGPKVRRGPCAKEIRFPAKGVELQAEWLWLSKNHDRWSDEKLPSPANLATFDAAVFERSLWLDNTVRIALGLQPKVATESVLREDIARWRAEIQKRAQVKGWLEKLGVNWKEAFEPERALFFVFDRLHADEQPTSA